MAESLVRRGLSRAVVSVTSPCSTSSIIMSGAGPTSGLEPLAREEKLVLGRGCFLGRNRSVNPEDFGRPVSASSGVTTSSSITSGRVDSNDVLSLSRSLLADSPRWRDSDSESDGYVKPPLPLGDSPRAHDANSCVCSRTPWEE